MRAAIGARDPLARPETLIPRVYAFVAYRIGDGPDAEDITSDTFKRALRYRASFDPSKGDALTWLIGIARRQIAAARSGLAEQWIESTETAAPGDLEGDAIRRLTLSTAVAGLDERDRELIALRYGADLTARQIGALLDLRTNAAEVALHRAMGRLRERLEPAGLDESPSPTRAAL